MFFKFLLVGILFVFLQAIAGVEYPWGTRKLEVSLFTNNFGQLAS